jgi:DNA-binding Lrp family transcriptional regulator
MVNAWVLIQTEVGKAGDVAKAVSAIDGIQRADVTAGPFDVIAQAEAPDLNSLGALVLTKVQSVPGTTRTLTCPLASRRRRAR